MVIEQLGLIFRLPTSNSIIATYINYFERGEDPWFIA